MAIRMTTALRNARAQAIIDTVDAGGDTITTEAVLLIYGGTRPSTGGSAAGNTLLGTLVMSQPCGTISSGVLTLQPVTSDTSADADGTITWARIADSDGVAVMDFSCGLTGSSADITFNAVDVLTGGTISLVSGTITEGNA